MSKVTVAAVQMTYGLENAMEKVREAASQGAQIILLPELFENWYFCQEKSYENYHLATTLEENPAVNALRTQNTRYPVVVSWQYSFDSGSPDEAQIAFLRDMMGTFADNREGLVYASYTVESIAFNRGDFVGTYGSLFFLAILLSIVFLAAAVLILYYKQISEGYEDQARFEIMQRVGMTKTDIRKSINSQLLLVFFLPLLFAGLHLGFAFPFIHKLLMLFNLTNLKLLIGTTVITFAIYAVFYTLVYRITSNSYYSIVAGAKEDAA